MKKYNRVAFVHIPKTGGRTILHTLDEKHKLGLKLPNYPSKTESIHFTYDEYKKENYDIFFSCIRIPHDWLQSFYYYTGFDIRTRRKRLEEVRKHKTFEKFILEEGYMVLKERFGLLTQSEWVKQIPIENLLRTNFLQHDFDQFTNKYNLTNVRLITTGVNKRVRDKRINNETMSKIQEVFAEDYKLFEKVSEFRTIK